MALHIITQTDLCVLIFDSARIAAAGLEVRWEDAVPAPGGEVDARDGEFPHVYGALRGLTTWLVKRVDGWKCVDHFTSVHGWKCSWADLVDGLVAVGGWYISHPAYVEAACVRSNNMPLWRLLFSSHHHHQHPSFVPCQNTYDRYGGPIPFSCATAQISYPLIDGKHAIDLDDVAAAAAAAAAVGVGGAAANTAAATRQTKVEGGIDKVLVKLYDERCATSEGQAAAGQHAEALRSAFDALKITEEFPRAHMCVGTYVHLHLRLVFFTFSFSFFISSSLLPRFPLFYKILS
jgi:hypothetical protein